jgi:hypothetical protein
MNISKIVFCLLAFMQTAAGQKTIYSGADVASTSQYQVVGKVGENFMVFTSAGWRKKLLVYDRNMKKLSNNLQKYMPDDVHKIAAIPIDGQLIVTYRYVKKNNIYFDAVKLDAYGKRISAEVRIDSMALPLALPSQELDPSGWNSTHFNTPVLITGNKNTTDQTFGPYRLGETKNPDNYPILDTRLIDYYSVIHSEDKSKILVYKIVKTDRGYSLEAKILNHDLKLMDVFKMPLAFPDEYYSPLLIDNDGNIFFLTQTTAAKDGSIKSLQLFSKMFGVNNYVRVPVDLQEHILLRPHFKIDNLNKSLVINSFYLDPLKENQPEGIFIFKLTTKLENMQSVYKEFPPALSSLRYRLVPQKIGMGQTLGFVNFFFIHDMYFTKDGSYQLVAGRTTNTNDFSIDSVNIKTLQPEIVFINIDSGLHIIGTSIFSRKDMVEHPGLLSSYSFDVLNQGNSLHLMINAQTMNNISVTSRFNISQGNKIIKYPPQRERETGYSLLPQQLIQVGLEQQMIPFKNVKNNIGFALIQLED